MDINLKRVGRALIVALEGELDLATAPRVKDTVDQVLARDAKLHHLVWDLAKVEFIDSSGLGMLLGRYNKISARAGSVVLMRPAVLVRRMLVMAGMGRIMQFVDSEEQALAKIGGDTDGQLH
ncbi:MAG: anti-sigma factor antagonist [Firmicutes bacterium]|nr:anti-sigma factor antagonist [Bacillota bacterium]